MPALFTRMSTRPWRFWISAAVLATCALSPTSHTIASKPAFLSVASLRPETTTLAPAPASATAPARPMPEPPPVIHATLFWRLAPGILGLAEQHLRLLLAEARRLPPPVGEHLHRLLHRRTRGDRVAPALHVRILLD